MNQYKTKAFTLIELSISLIIIGLIVSGITVGTSLVAQSKLRAVIKENQDIISAFGLFKDAYNGLPGDLANATYYFGTTDKNGHTVTNGNGDGVIGNAAGSIATQENYSAWQELALAGLVKGNYTGASTGVGNGVGSGINVYGSAYGNNSSSWFYSGTISGTNYPSVNSLALTGSLTLGVDNPIIAVADAQYIDNKIDDNIPYTGLFIGYNATANNCVAAALSTNPTHSTSAYLVLTNTFCSVHFALPTFVFQ